MRITTWILLAMWCLRVVKCQDEQEPLRYHRRPNRHEGITSYRTNVLHDNDNRQQQSMSSVAVQLHLKDEKQVSTENEDGDYITAPSLEEVQFKPLPIKRPHTLQQHANRKSHAAKINSLADDSETGASNNQAAARYVLPPEGFLNHLKNQGQQFNQNQESGNSFATTQSPQYEAHPNNQYQQNYNEQQRSNYGNKQRNYNEPQQPQQQQQNNLPNYNEQQHGNQINYNEQQQNFNEQQQNFNEQQQNFNDQQQSFNAAASHVHYVATAAPPQFSSTFSPRNQYVSSPTSYQQSAPSSVQYVSSPLNYDPNSQEAQFGNNAQSSNIRYISTAPSRVQYISSPSSVQYGPQESNNQVQYASTPSPNVQYISTPPPHEHYVSSPVHFVSTQSPIQFSTSTPVFGSRINQQQNNQEKQMQIDHFDNAMSGVRSPKYQQSNFFSTTTTTPAPMIISTTITPIPKQNEQQWRINQNQNQFNNQNQDVKFNVQSHQNSQLHPNNFQEQSLNLNAVESANNYVVNVVHPNPSRHRFQLNKSNQQRDLDKDTEVAPSYSSSQFGWKLSPKKNDNQQSNSIEQPKTITYTSFNNNNNNQGAQALPLHSAPYEYRPYPDNPFLNHISFPSPSPPIKSGSIQSISFKPDNNEQQNVNVGYSIGFGNGNQETLKADQSSYANKYPFNNNVQSFTTAVPNTQNDVIKGFKISQVNMPESTLFIKDNGNPQEYVANALKINEKLKYTNSVQYGNNNNQGFQYNVPGVPYKIEAVNQQGNFNNHGYNSPKTISFQTISPNNMNQYHGDITRGDSGKSFKWTNISPGVEITSGSTAKPLTVEVESVTPNSVMYFNNQGDVITNTPFIFASQKDNQGGRLVNFDHANAMKNVQPIDISNVVSYSPTPMPEVNNVVSVSPHYINQQNVQSYPPQLNPIPNGHLIQHFPQDQSHIQTGSINNPNLIEQGVSYSNFKPTDKNVIYNIQSVKPKFSGFEGTIFNEIKSAPFSFSKPREQFAFDANQQQIYHNHPMELLGHSSNVENRQVSNNMMYVPSDAFRRSNQGRDSQTDQSSSVHVTHNDGQTSSNYHHEIAHDLQGQYSNNKDDVYERINQNMYSHHLEPMPSSSENNYRMVSSKRSNGEEVTYEQTNDIDSTLTTINGIQIANPYNVDLKIVSDLLNGKPAIDESKLEPIRKHMSNMTPIKLDTSAIQKVVTSNEQADSDSFINRQYMRDQVDAKPYQDEQYEKYQHSVPNIASEQLQNSLQSILNSHQIGAVVEQSGFKSNVRSRDMSPVSELQEFNDSFEASSSEFGERENVRSGGFNLNNLASADNNKHPKSDMIEPYPLLKPPRLPISPSRGNSHKKTKKEEKRPYGARHNRHLGHRHTRPYKSIHENEEELNSYRIQTELRPPPVNMAMKKMG